MLSNLETGDILLADANIENYCLLALSPGTDVDAALEKNDSHSMDFRKYQEKQGKRDCLFRLVRPRRPDWMDQELYDQMPAELRGCPRIERSA